MLPLNEAQKLSPKELMDAVQTGSPSALQVISDLVFSDDVPRSYVLNPVVESLAEFGPCKTPEATRPGSSEIEAPRIRVALAALPIIAYVESGQDAHNFDLEIALELLIVNLLQLMLCTRVMEEFGDLAELENGAVPDTDIIKGVERTLALAFDSPQFSALVKASFLKNQMMQSLVVATTKFWFRCTAFSAYQPVGMLRTLMRFVDLGFREEVLPGVQNYFEPLLAMCFLHTSNYLLEKEGPYIIDDLRMFGLMLQTAFSRPEIIECLIRMGFTVSFSRLIRRVASPMKSKYYAPDEALYSILNSPPRDHQLAATLMLYGSLVHLFAMHHGYKFLLDALEDHVLISLIRIRGSKRRLYPEDEYLPSTASGQYDKVAGHAVAAIIPYMIWPSVRKAVLRELRRIRNCWPEGRGPRLDSALLKLEAVAKEDMIHDKFKEEVLTTCSNPKCARKASALTSARMKRCVSCRHRVYCSFSCQSTHWRERHSEYCKSVAPRRQPLPCYRHIDENDVEMLLYTAQKDLLIREDTIDPKLDDLRVSGYHSPTILMDYRNGRESLTVRVVPDFSAASVLEKTKADKWKDFLGDPGELWELAEGAVKQSGGPVVVILAPYSFELPYAQFTTYNWLVSLWYGTEDDDEEPPVPEP